MANPFLTNHYNKKYAHEKEPGSLGIVRNTSLPTNRYEACIKYFPRYFSGGDVLELAAGNGKVANSLLKYNDNKKIARYVASDFSASRLAGLTSNISDERFAVAEIDAERVGQEHFGKYDAVIMIALIEHLIDPLRAMQAIRKLLKPNGIAYIDTANIAKYPQRIKLLFGRFPSTASRDEGLTTFKGPPVDLLDEGHLHYFTFRCLSKMLTERCGFSKITQLPYPGGFMAMGKHIHHMLAHIRPELFSELAIIAHV